MRTWRNIRLLPQHAHRDKRFTWLDPCSRHFRLHMHSGKSYNKKENRAAYSWDGWLIWGLHGSLCNVLPVHMGKLVYGAHNLELVSRCPCAMIVKDVSRRFAS
ncbi:hypothetical protein KCV03_g252, partial [Aureobasidium melanogenum]